MQYMSGCPKSELACIFLLLITVNAVGKGFSDPKPHSG